MGKRGGGSGGGRGGGSGGGGGGGNKRMRDMDDNEKGGPSKQAMKGLEYNTSNQPAFLRNALAALSGPQAPKPEFDEHGRPSVPERPEGEKEEEPESEEDEWDMGRGEEAPAVVVLNDARHIGREEVDRIRAAAKAEFAADPLASSSAPTLKLKSGSSLNLTGTSGPRKLADGEEFAVESWSDVISRSKVEAIAKKEAKELQDVEDKKNKDKAERVKKKEKKAREKAVGRLSFADDE